MKFAACQVAALFAVFALAGCQAVSYEDLEREALEVIGNGEQGEPFVIVVSTEVYGFAGVKLFGFPIIPGVAIVKERAKREPPNTPSK